MIRYGKKTKLFSRKTYDKYITSMLNELSIIECEVGKETHSKSKNYHGILKQLILLMIQEQIIDQSMFENINDQRLTVNCFKHLKLSETILLNCCHTYYGDDEWFDWINVDWGDMIGIVPAKVFCFLDTDEMIVFNDNRVEEYNVLPDDQNHSNKFVLIQSVLKESKVSTFTSKLAQNFIMEPFLRLVSIESIKSTAYVICDIKDVDDTDFLIRKNVFSIARRESWSSLFIDQCSMNEYN